MTEINNFWDNLEYPSRLSIGATLEPASNPYPYLYGPLGPT
jgi:hypothetical protein